MKKCTVTLYPSGRSVKYPEGTSLLDIFEDQGIVINAPCGGKGICGKCRVKAEGALSERSESEKGLPEGERLACVALIQGDVDLHVPERSEAPVKSTGIVLPSGPLGIAVDLGTTSIQASLVSLASCETLATVSFLNPQRRYGHDVISRIAAASDPEKGKAITRLIQEEVASLAELFASAQDLSLKEVSALSLSGNTTMTYAFLGMDITPLGRHPYRAATLEYGRPAPGDYGIESVTEGLYLLPGASAFCGGDLVGGCAVAQEYGFEEGAFFFDIGTNGEMFLRAGESILATSCAMGPALEGMNISCGMTAHSGAVDHVGFTGNKFTFTVIDNETPVGLAGTGIIDFIACLLKAGLVDPSGSFSRSIGEQIRSVTGVEFLEREMAVALSPHVYLTQKDIRNVQLAKGASLAASKMLLAEAGVSPEEVRNVVIAGAFGRHLDLDNFRKLAFVPDFSAARWHFLGNTSLTAAERYLCRGSFRETLRDLREKITVLELSDNPEFNDLFLSSLDF